MPSNLLKNDGFEAGWAEEKSHRCLVFSSDKDQREQLVGNIFTPPHWTTWFRHEPGKWDQPEVRDTWKNMDSRRVQSGQKGVLLFTFYRNHDAGFLQQVQVEPGTQLRFTAWAHAWSNHPIEGHEDCTDNAKCSAGVGCGSVFLLKEDVPPLTGETWNDAIGNFSFMVGIDPTGGVNPYVETVVWGPAAHIYNEYRQVPPVEATAQAETVTVFLRSRTLWKFKHNDAYWDTAELVAINVSPTPQPPAGTPSKLGIHVLRADGVGELLGAGPAVVKFADDWGSAANVPKSTLVVGAKPVSYDARSRREAGLSPREAAEQFVSDMQSIYEANPTITYWEGFRAPVCDDEDSMAWYAQFEIERMELMSEMGLKCVIGNFATGTPALELWPAFLPAVEAGLEYEAILGLHEYSCPWMWWLTGKHQPDPNDDQGDEGWATLRYRKVYRQYLLPNRLQIPLVITECGIDPLVNPKPPGAPAATWKGLGEFWRENNDEPDKADYYFRQLAWYDGELCKDEYVVGMAVFTWGNWDGTWKDFDVAGTPVAEKLIQYAKDYAPGPDAEPFRYTRYSGGIAPVISYVPPREPYHRTYVLLPEIEDTVERVDWRVAAAIGTSVQMRTLGHSVNDAGVGPEDCEIVLINPKRWGGDLAAWYDEHYPKASYETIETDSPWEMAIKLLPPLEDDIALAQADSRWVNYNFGEPLDAAAGGGMTIGPYGCLLTGLAISLRKVYQRAVTPPLLDKILLAARAAYTENNAVTWQDIIPLFPVFDDSLQDGRQRSAAELEELLRDGWEILLEQGDGDHLAYLERVEEGTLHVIDPSDGDRKEIAAADCRGVKAARLRKSNPAFESVQQPSQPGAGWAPPIRPYQRTYVLLPQIKDATERVDWRIAAAIGSAEQIGANENWAIGHSADDAGVGPQDRQIIAVNPAQWGGDLQAWYDEHYPNAKYKTVETESPWEMAIRLLPLLNEDIALAQSDPRWAGYDFGEQPGTDEGTIGRYGCFLTGLATILRRVYQRAVTPPVLDKLLVAARAAYANDNLLMWEGVVPLFPAFDDGIKDSTPRSARELRQLLRAGWEIVLRQADGSHFVYLEDVEGDVLHIIDTWDGKRKEKSAADYAGIRAVHIKSRGYPLPPKILVGLHDESGGKWMVEHKIAGCCLVHQPVQRQPAKIDCRHLQKAGITVICRLNWGYADGTGTLPRPADKQAFVDAVVKTILTAQGVNYFHVGNEPNNRSEWPGYGTNREFALTAAYVTEIYNEVWERVAGADSSSPKVRLGPPPLDPYFGPHSNNREWWQYILDNIVGADALFLHAKTQTNAPNEVWSRMRFTDEPLTWQYLHLRTVETALAILPDRFRSLPIFVTELNPQCLETIKGKTGWMPDNAEWVHEALDYFRGERPVTGVVLYRYEPAGDQASFGLESKTAILNAIKEEAKA
jgi:hypothetical protein